MNYCLVDPGQSNPAPRHNAGWYMITAGIKYLIAQADPQAVFTSIDMMKDWPLKHDFTQHDAIVICGNPRYDHSEDVGSWLYGGMLEKIKKLGLPVLDAWQGTGCELGLDYTDAVDAMCGYERNQNIARLLLEIDAVCIARDHITQKINDRFGLNSVQMPCSSWWAKYFFGVEISDAPIFDKAVIPARLAGYACGSGFVRTLSKTHDALVTNAHDAEWCENVGIDYKMVYDPRELLQLYGKYNEIITYRLHAGIPAASMGAKVFVSAIDSRADACQAFDIPHDDYREGIGEAKMAVAPPAPDLKPILSELFR